MASRVIANTHVHVPPNFSAFGDVHELVTLAVDQGVGVLGVSNYYDFDVYLRFAEEAAAAGVHPLFGMEVMCLLDDLLAQGIRINDPGNPGKMYLCGKGLGRSIPMSAEAAELMAVVRETDGARIRALVTALTGVFARAGFPVEVAVPDVVASVAARAGVDASTVHLQERHVAQAFAEALFARVAEPGRADALRAITGADLPTDPAGVQTGLRGRLMKAGQPAYVPETFVGFDHAYALVLALGGIPCYPVLADGVQPLCAFEEPVEALAGYLLARGIHCAELIPSRNDPAVLITYAQGLRAAGLVVLAGTEHNSLAMAPLEPRCADGSPAPDDVRDLFWEGTCVVAAHQARAARGEPGFLDPTGKPDPSFGSADERIAAYAAEGARVVAATLDGARARRSGQLVELSRRPAGPTALLPDDERDRLVAVVAPALRALTGSADTLGIVTFDDSTTVRVLVTDPDGRRIAAGGPLTADRIVHCRSLPLWFEPVAGEPADDLVDRLAVAVREHTDRYGGAPRIALVPGVGLFAAGTTWAEADTARQVYVDAVAVMAGARRPGGVHYLPDGVRSFIERWEVESLRRQVAPVSGATPGRVSGKVALVTGAAQGFGLEIARGLATQGAHVVLADLNLPGVEQVAAELRETFGAGRAIGVGVDVTSGPSVTAAVQSVLRHYGGLDLLVSNAGVLRAESVKTQPERDFDLSTAVNYKGYFLCVRAVAPVLAVQHRARPSYWSDVVQINSKSGLVGSSKNFAYAGSKFGGIGLTQSFALELVTDGIKVNSICPGNFFDGPLWSDPVNGLFVQYLRTGKVPGATTVDDVRRAYEAKVPMARGCTTADVLKALYYLVDQLYETGQALPVTGGQVMLA